MEKVEMVFRKWRTRKDEEIQAQLNALSSRFITQANAILERLEHAAGILFEIPVEHLEIACPLRVESHLYYKVETRFLFTGFQRRQDPAHNAPNWPSGPGFHGPFL
jgi:hypothetical protein